MKVAGAASGTLADSVKSRAVERKQAQQEATSRQLDQEINGGKNSAQSKASGGSPGSVVDIYA